MIRYPKMRIKLGIDGTLEDALPSLKKQNWGLVTNDAARTREGVRTRLALLQKDWKIRCLFSPEHGLSATGMDGQAQSHHKDQLTGLPVYSLYGPQFIPALHKLTEIDGVLFDLPDAGVRFYTYLWTLSYLMEACLEAHKPLVILDRPNPLSGRLDLAEGPMLDEATLSSFIGRWRLPIRHSLTFGELAMYWKEVRRMSGLEIQVIPCQNWGRDQYIADTDLPFFPPSPAINELDSLLTYPALCFMEGLNVNEGRGTSIPFQQFGAPWIDGKRLASLLNENNFPGVYFQAVSYTPDASRYVGEKCHGVHLKVVDRTIYRPVQTGIGILALLCLHFSEKVEWSEYPTHANPTGMNHLDLLLGNSHIRPILEETPIDVLSKLNKIVPTPEWKNEAQPYLLYV
jgi:uncharacterized protein YbbC (DUF1343 family)